MTKITLTQSFLTRENMLTLIHVISLCKYNNMSLQHLAFIISAWFVSIAAIKFNKYAVSCGFSTLFLHTQFELMQFFKLFSNFQSLLKQLHPPVIADQFQDGRCTQAWGTAFYQRSSCERQRRCARLLPHFCLCSLWGDCWDPGTDGTVWLHFLFFVCISPLPVVNSQGRTPMEQIL